MTIEKKLLGTNASGDKPNIADVFSTYLYAGDGGYRTITNAIDLSNEGGMVWIKDRDAVTDHRIFDTARGATKALQSNSTSSEATKTTQLTAFNSTGFNLGGDADVNGSNDYVSWTFRKAPKFFDVVTYTGNATAGRTIAHSLGGDVGMMMIKNVSMSGNWVVYHKSTAATKYLYLNTTVAAGTYSGFWNDTAPTSTDFTLGSNNTVNNTGDTFVAYLFADNTAEDADEQMIKCGSYTGNGTDNSLIANLGWEPQFMLVKRTNAASDWIVVDSMRGAVAGGTVNNLYANGTSATAVAGSVAPSSEGIRTGNSGDWGESNASGGNYIYMAIRAPMMKKPDDATKVFAVDQGDTTSNPNFLAGFPVDMGIVATTGAGGNNFTASRLTEGQSLHTEDSNAETASTATKLDNSTSWWDDTRSTAWYSWMWKRAKGFFDVVAHTGNGTAGRTINHSLSVTPEFILSKNRTTAGTHWAVYHKGCNDGVSPEDYYVILNNSGQNYPDSDIWNDTAPSSTVFTVGANEKVNANSANYVVYLFATLAGVSKVGFYTGTAADLNVDCGFAAGARFILIKRTDSAGDWYFWDTTRGIVAGNDPYLLLNDTAAEVTGTDYIDPLSSGFTVTSSASSTVNVSSGTYIFLAIA